ncbi:putative lipoprotein [Chitinispirillum alkaliphilum]|nr:putative lipoprotein [Chitinispirillum alkaliphilum]
MLKGVIFTTKINFPGDFLVFFNNSEYFFRYTILYLHFFFLLEVVTGNLVPNTIWALASVLGKTWRTKLEAPSEVNPYIETGKGVIYCFWHSRLFALAHIFRNTGKTAVVSKSRDGRRAAKIAQNWGHDIIFGSSSNGGASALRQCIRTLKEGRSVVITPDGPKGPIEKAKTGVAQISLLSGAPIVILDIIAKKQWRLNSWDKLIVPKAFSEVIVTASDPIYPTPFCDITDPAEAFTLELQDRFKT